MRAGQLRHTVNVMRPAPPRGDRDQEDDPQVLREKVQCSIETISGREAQRLPISIEVFGLESLNISVQSLKV